jgi:hypothetical protein
MICSSLTEARAMLRHQRELLAYHTDPVIVGAILRNISHLRATVATLRRSDPDTLRPGARRRPSRH